MKKLDLQSTADKQLLAEFELHLQTLNYSKSTVYTSNNSAKEYLFYLQENKLSLNQIKETTPYFDYLQNRSNQRRDGGLSIGYLKKQLGAIKQFYTFLHHSKGTAVPIFPMLPKPRTNPKVLTKEQIQMLFKTCDNTLFGKRNKAILALYYGLGLRRAEGANLQVEDIDLERNEVFVRKSKTKRQRHVPMNEGTQKIIEDYLFSAREMLLPSSKSSGSFLISQRGQAMSVYSIDYVVKKLAEKTKDEKLKKSFSGTHTLRHSIATHLLQAEMKLEDIALFLGHKSLDSTQIYTSIK